MREDFVTHQFWCGEKHSRTYQELLVTARGSFISFPTFRCQEKKCRDVFSSGLFTKTADNEHELYVAALGRGWYFTDWGEYCPECSRRYITRAKHRFNAFFMRRAFHPALVVVGVYIVGILIAAGVGYLI